MLTPEGDVASAGNGIERPAWMDVEVRNEDLGRTVAQFAEAGQINETELEILFNHKYDKDITISDPLINTKLITDRPWPTYMEVGRLFQVKTGGGDEESDHGVNVAEAEAQVQPIGITEDGELIWPDPDDIPPVMDVRTSIQLSRRRWALYIDDDLDFIVPKAHLRSEKFENTNFLDTNPNNWQKLPWRFMPESDMVLYPRATGARIGPGEHLPNLTEDAVRALVRTEYNGFPARLLISTVPPRKVIITAIL